MAAMAGATCVNHETRADSVAVAGHGAAGQGRWRGGRDGRRSGAGQLTDPAAPNELYLAVNIEFSHLLDEVRAERFEPLIERFNGQQKDVHYLGAAGGRRLTEAAQPGNA